MKHLYLAAVLAFALSSPADAAEGRYKISYCQNGNGVQALFDPSTLRYMGSGNTTAKVILKNGKVAFATKWRYKKNRLNELNVPIAEIKSGNFKEIQLSGKRGRTTSGLTLADFRKALKKIKSCENVKPGVLASM